MLRITEMSKSAAVLLILSLIPTVQSTCTVDSNCDLCGGPELYGADCSLACPANCESGCNRTTGQCDHGCKKGYRGSFCNLSCPVDCKHGCNQTTGYCFQHCDPGRYGDTCNKTCSRECQICERHSGECTKGTTTAAATGIRLQGSGKVVITSLCSVLLVRVMLNYRGMLLTLYS